MSNYQYSQDLLNDALFRAGEPIDGTSDFQTKALDYLNRAYQAIWMGGAELDPTLNEDWEWLKSSTPGVITLEPMETGTVSVQNGNQVIGFASAPTSSRVGWFFRIENGADVFRIDTHTAGQQLAALDSIYTGATAAAATYTLYKLEYTLATDVLRLLSPMRIYRENRQKVYGCSLTALENTYPLTNLQTGAPRLFAQIGEQKVRFSHAGGTEAGDYFRVDYDYLQKPAALTNSAVEEPLLPLARRRILADFVTYWLMLDKNDDRADTEGLTAKAGLKAMAAENRHRMASYTSNFGAIITRPADLPQNLDVVRTESGLIIG